MNTSKSYFMLSCLMVLFSVASYGVTENFSQCESDAARISMLEKALAPHTPEAVASLFAKANKERNGAVQFMLFSNQLKAKYKDSWPYWVSGVSSPWITTFKIKKIKQNKMSWIFQITYQWTTADGPFHPDLMQTIVIETVAKNTPSSQKFWITSFSEK